MRPRLTTAVRALAAALVLALLLTAPPVLLVAYIGNPIPPEGLSLGVTDGVVIGLLAAVVWLLWAQLIYCTLVEAVAVARGTRFPQQAPALAMGWQQHLIRTLVTAIVAAVLSTPAAPAPTTPLAAADQLRLSAPSWAPTPAASALAEPVSGDRETTSVEQSAPDVRPDVRRVERLHRVRVGARDSLWSLAQRHLGDPERWHEIAELNRGRTMVDGRIMRSNALIYPGWVLRMPADATGLPPLHGPATVTVQAGDTLSALAEQHLGDPARWPELYEANRDRVADPGLLQPRWRLHIPRPQAASTDGGGAGVSGRRQRRGSNDVVAPGSSREERIEKPDRNRYRGGDRAENSAAPSQPAAPSTVPRHAAPAPDEHPPAEEASDADAPASAAGQATEQEVQVSPAWLVGGLTGAGSLLATALLLLLRRRRREQVRARRPGRTIAGPAPELAPVEKTLVAAGEPAIDRVELLDEVLRRLAAATVAAGEPMPALAAVQLSGRGIVLHLSRPAELAEPFQPSADRLRWTWPTDTDPNRAGRQPTDQPAPYPQLVAIGTDPGGDVWLLNLEEAGTVSITGDPATARDLARHVAAELVCNPWSSQVGLNCLGIGEEIAAMDPARVRAVVSGEPVGAAISEAHAQATELVARAAETGHDAVTGRAAQAADEVWPTRALLVDAAAEAPGLDRLLALIDDEPGRTGTAVIVTGERRSTPGVVLDVTDTGSGRLPHAGLQLAQVVRLTHTEAVGAASLLAQARVDDPVDIPDHGDGDVEPVASWRGYSNQAGALRREHTLPRDSQPAAGHNGTLLDGDDEDYLAGSATTRQDLQALSPHPRPGLGEEIAAADPDLDADLAAWFSEDCELPRLRLLGPVQARTRGMPLVNRKPYYTELLAFLALRPQGVRPEEVAEAFGTSPAKARTNVKTVRDWLGANPRTGAKHLPDATKSPAAQARGVGVYQVQDLLLDVDLFRRLRVRAEARGRDGLPDLLAAMRLVAGVPFDHLRPGGWSWLYEGDRIDQHMVCAVVDVAHLVTTRALKDGDLDQARAAAETAARAAPHEEIPRLDLAAVASAAGHEHEAELILQHQVCDRCDDDGPPPELSARTREVLDRRRWLGANRTAS